MTFLQKLSMVTTKKRRAKCRNIQIWSDLTHCIITIQIPTNYENMFNGFTVNTSSDVEWKFTI